MDNKRVNQFQPKLSRKTPPHRVFFTWEITYNCNYRCTYCHAPKPCHDNVRKTVYLKPDRWVKIWNEVYENYGPCYILMSGGEPFVYPSLTELIVELQRNHILEFCTNLEWNVKPFVKKMDPKRVKVGTSFHPEFAKLNRFISKLRMLKDSGFQVTTNFVPWPPLLGKMSGYKEAIEKIGVQFILQPYIGEYESRRYPQGYTESEREYFKIFKDSCNINTLDFKTTEKSNKKGKLCRMGQNYAFIHPDGEVERCCKDHSLKLGNIVDGTFRLLQEPAPCTIDECNCWRCMLVETEPGWVSHWGWSGMEDVSPVSISEKNIKANASKTISKEEPLMKIALVQPLPWGVFDPPVALAQLSSYLKHKGYKVEVIDINIELYNSRKEEYKTIWAIEQSGFWHNQSNVSKFFKDNIRIIEDYIKKILVFEPQIIAFSVNSASLHFTLEFIKRIKEVNPKIKIVFGGAMFLVPADIESILQNDYVDIVILGEGEEPLSELLEILKEGKSLSQCRGICFKQNGKIVSTESRSLLKDLDSLPFLDFTDLPLDKYDPPGHLGRHISIMTSRGCPQMCVFCGPKAYWPGYRTMSGKRIYEEIKYHIQNHPEIEHVEFLDLLFNGSIKTLTDFCDLMISNPVKQSLRWHANAIIRPEMTPELLRKMKRAGCHHLTYGIESGSQHVLDLMRKRYRIEDADKVVKSTHEAGIQVTCNFMFGFPGETEEDFQQTLKFIKRNGKYIATAYPSRTYCTIEPHSYLEKHMEEFAIVSNPRNNLYWESKDGKNQFPIRLKRCETFSLFTSSLGVPIGSGLQTSVELDRLYNLGFYYEAKDDYKNSLDCFIRYLELDPKNEIINQKVSELKRNYLNKPGFGREISFNWDIHYRCNYRCPYCWFFGKWTEVEKQNIYPPLEQLIGVWKKIYSLYGPVKISITGGEPFLYPKFTELIKELSQMHRIEIITNLSVDIERFINEIRQAVVNINPSFHSLYADFDKFVSKVLLLKDRQMVESVSYLAWPPQIPLLQNYQERFNKFGISLSIQSFFGEYKGIKYPDGYTEQEKQIIMPQLGTRGGKLFQTEPIITKGKRCAAGHRYGVIHPDGKVLRCGGMNSSMPEGSIIGNLLDEDFRLLIEPSLCTFEVCPCNEWAFLLEEGK